MAANFYNLFSAKLCVLFNLLWYMHMYDETYSYFFYHTVIMAVIKISVHVKCNLEQPKFITKDNL